MCYNVAVGVIVLALWGFLSVSSQEICDSRESIEVMQTTCKNENEALVYSEEKNDNTEVCRHFFLLLKCGVSALPNCFGYLEKSFEMYTHSPFSCKLTQEQILELQKIYLEGTQVTRSSPATGETTPAPVTKTEYITSTSARDQVTTHQHNGSHNGNEEKHKGGNPDNGAAVVVVSRYSLVLLVLVSAKWMWWVKS